MASWSGGGTERRVGVADMIGKLVVIYVTGYHRNVPTRKYGAPQIVEEQDQLHADVVLIDKMTGAAIEYRDQTIRSWSIIKVARGSVGGDPLLGTMESPNGQANNAKWRSLAEVPEATAAADRWVSQYGPEGYKRSAAREPDAHTPQAPQQQQGYHGWPQGSMPAQQYYQQQQAPPQWANQQPQYGQPQPMPPQQPAPQWANQPQAPQPPQQQPQGQQWGGNQQQGYGGQQGQPQWQQSQPPQGYQQAPQWTQQQPPQQQVNQQQQPQTSLQAMMAAGAVAPPPQAPMGYDGAPADQGPPPF